MSYSFEDAGDHARFFYVYTINLGSRSLILKDFKIMLGVKLDYGESFYVVVVGTDMYILICSALCALSIGICS